MTLELYSEKRLKDVLLHEPRKCDRVSVVDQTAIASEVKEVQMT